MATQPIVVDGVEFQGEILDQDESDAFDYAYDRFMAPVDNEFERTFADPTVPNSQAQSQTVQTAVLRKTYKTETNYVSAMFQQRKEHVRNGVMIAKNLIGGAFKGVAGHGPELNMSWLQSWHLLRKATTAAETPSETWANYQDTSASGTFTNAPSSAAGSSNWLGWGSTNSTNINIDKRALVCILGFTIYDANRFVRSVKFTVDGVAMIPTQFQPYVQVAFNSGRAPFVPSKTYIFGPKANLGATIYVDQTSPVILVPLGFVIGQASYLINEIQTTVTL